MKTTSPIRNAPQHQVLFPLLSRGTKTPSCSPLLALAMAGNAPAANQTWTGSASGNWDTTSNNWTGTWTNNNNATFTASGSNKSITIASGISVQNATAADTFVISVTGGTYAFGGSTLTITNPTSNVNSFIQNSGTGTVTFNINIDASSGANGSLRILPTSTGDITFNNGINAGTRQLQLGFFGTTAGAINLTGGTVSTTNAIVSTNLNTSITGSTTLSTTNAYSQANGTTTLNGAGASLSSAGTPPPPLSVAPATRPR